MTSGWFIILSCGVAISSLTLVYLLGASSPSATNAEEGEGCPSCSEPLRESGFFCHACGFRVRDRRRVPRNDEPCGYHRMETFPNGRANLRRCADCGAVEWMRYAGSGHWELVTPDTLRGHTSTTETPTPTEAAR